MANEFSTIESALQRKLQNNRSAARKADGNTQSKRGPKRTSSDKLNDCSKKRKNEIGEVFDSVTKEVSLSHLQQSDTAQLIDPDLDLKHYLGDGVHVPKLALEEGLNKHFDGDEESAIITLSNLVEE